MLDAGRYLLGVAELAVLVGFSTLGAAALRSRLLPSLSGPPAWLATAVVALAILIWVAELLGSFGLFKALPYVVGVMVAGLVAWAFGRGPSARGWPSPGRTLIRAPGRRPPTEEASPSVAPARASHADYPRGRSVSVSVLTVVSLLVTLVAVARFAAGVRLRLSTGMTGFDSTWYHGPLAVEFFQTGNTFDLHFIAPQYLAWFYPANAEISPCDRDGRVQSRHLVSADQFRLVLGVPARRLVHRAAVSGWAGVAGLGRDCAERPGAGGSGRGGSE